MVEHIYSEEYSRILMFVLFFTKDIPLVDHIVQTGNKIFGGVAECDVDATVAFATRLFTKPERVEIDESDITKNREGQRRLQDDAEDDDSPEPEKKIAYSEDLDNGEKVVFAGKTLDLLGQIVRNFPGSLLGDVKFRVIVSAYGLGLRMMQAIMEFSHSRVEELREFVREKYQEQEGSEPPSSQLDRLTDVVMMHLARFLGFGMLKRISYAVGYEKLSATYGAILKGKGKLMSVRLIDTSIKLDHFSAFPLPEVEELERELRQNLFARTLLTDLVASHMMIFPMHYRLKQKLGSLLGIDCSHPLIVSTENKSLPIREKEKVTA
jgi:hypothetical protein